MDRSIALTAFAATCAIVLGGASLDARAVTVGRTFYQNGGSACTGALPTFEGALRKRPKAIANEGTTSAFVTCSMVANDSNLAKPDLLFAYFTNRGAASVDVSCTLVNGDEFFGSTATPQTVSLPANVLTIMSFTPTAPDTTFARSVLSVSCALPPGVELNLVGQTIEEDVGA